MSEFPNTAACWCRDPELGMCPLHGVKRAHERDDLVSDRLGRVEAQVEALATMIRDGFRDLRSLILNDRDTLPPAYEVET